MQLNHGTRHITFFFLLQQAGGRKGQSVAVCVGHWLDHARNAADVVSEYRCMHRSHRVRASSIYAPYIPIALDTSIEFGASSGTDGSLSTRVLRRKGFNPDPCQVSRIKAGFFSLPRVGFRRLTARNKHVPYTPAAAAHRVLCRQK